MGEGDRKTALTLLRNRYLKTLAFQCGCIVAAILSVVVTIVFLSKMSLLFSGMFGLAAGWLLLDVPYIVLLWTHGRFVDFFGPVICGKPKTALKKKYAFISSYVADFFIRVILYLMTVAFVVPLTVLSLTARLIGLGVVCFKLFRLKQAETVAA